jgi:hypothetical protein
MKRRLRVMQFDIQQSGKIYPMYYHLVKNKDFCYNIL